MSAAPRVFLDFNLPNATTWFYFSLLLAVALFFKFSRVLSVRNWDVVMLFLLVPGLLLVQAARPGVTPQEERAARFVGQCAGTPLGGAADLYGPLAAFANDTARSQEAASWRWLGYLWLLIGSAYFLLRCFFDLALVQRPALGPNLSQGGLIWFAGALFICLMVVAFRQPERSGSAEAPPPKGVQSATARVGPQSAPLDLAQRPLEWSVWLLKALAVVCHLAVVLGLVMMGRLHFGDTSAGIGAATFYVLAPYTGLFVSQAHHVGPTALVIWALVSYRWPTWSGALLGLAAGTMYFPALILPLWLSFYWRRGAGRFLAAAVVAAALCMAVTAFDLWRQELLEKSLSEAWSQTAWQAWKVPTTEGFWTGLHWAYRIPIFLAYAAFVLLTAFWPMPKNLAQVIALSAAVFIGIQFWYADQGGVYVLWYLPLLLLMAFRPNLEERRPPLIDKETDWLARLGRALGRFLFRRLRSPEPAKL